MTYPADLSADTAVTPVPKVPGLYSSELSDRWSYLAPCGGVLMTTALRAMTAELSDPGLHLLSATTTFCQPIAPGQLLARVEVLRRGDSAAQLRASLGNVQQPGPGLEVLATFTRERHGPDMLGIETPKVPRPMDAERLFDRTFSPESLPFSFYRNVEMGLGIGDAMWKPGWSAGPAHVAYWYRYLVPQRRPNGEFDPLALPPLADTMPPALTRKLGPDHERYLMPSLDLTVYFLGPTTSEWILVEAFVERARAGFAIGSANLWDERGALVARAAQSMTLRARKW